MIPDIYTDGTVIVTNGSTTVTGVDTAWSTRVRKGSLLIVDGIVAVVASDPDSSDSDDHPTDTELELTQAWPGASTPASPSSESYQLVILQSGSTLASGFGDLIERLVGKGLGATTTGVPLASEGRDNDFRYDPTARLLYFKVAGAWELVTRPVAFDAFGEFAVSPSDRDQYDDEDAGFTFFATDTEVWYIKATDTSGDWSGPFSNKPPNDAGIGVSLDAQGSPIQAGHFFDVRVTFNATIRRVTLLADGAGSMVVDIRKSTFGNFPPGAGDSICASAKPTLSSAQTYEDSTLTGWTLDLVDGEVLRFHVESNDSITRVSVQLDVERQ